jgi:peptidyl-dipeptidase A
MIHFSLFISQIYSDFMQRGASLSSSQLIKLITRGKTSRLSVEPLLEFFRPLEAWLETQNRDEIVSIRTFFCSI